MYNQRDRKIPRECVGHDRRCPGRLQDSQRLKKGHQEILHRQSREIKLFKEELAKSQAETALLKTSQQRTQESLVALEDLRFMNIPEEADENCSDIVYNIIENELKIDPQDIRFHAVHRVGKPPSRNSDNSSQPRPRTIIARFVVREDRDEVFAVKNRLKHSRHYKDAYITKDYARAIQEERKTLIQAMYVAKEQGYDAKVVNRTLYINKEAFNVTNIPHDFRPTAP